MPDHYSPEALRLLADLADALSAPLNQSRFRAPDRIPITDPNGGPQGTLVWDSQGGTYRWHAHVPAQRSGDDE